MKYLERLINRKPNKTSLIKRAFAYGIDWYLGSVLASIPLILTYYMMHNNAKNIPNQLSLFHGPLVIAVALLCFTVTFLYYVMIPVHYHGATLGKRIVHLKIVNDDYTEISLKKLIIRQVVLMMLVEGSVYATTATFHQLLRIYFDTSLINIYTTAGLIITVASVVLMLITKSHQSLHDLLCHTLVVDTGSPDYQNEMIDLSKKMKKKHAQAA